MTVNLLSSNDNELPANIISTVKRNQQEFCKPLNSQIFDSLVAADLDTSSNFLQNYSVNSSRNTIPTNLKRSLLFTYYLHISIYV